MDSIRSFKTIAKQRHRAQRAEGREARTLQQVQHSVAQEAGFKNWSAVLAADEAERRQALQTLDNFESRFARLLDELPHLTRDGLESWGDDPARREALRGDVDTVQWVHDWLRESVAPIKQTNRRRSSYGIKHIAENVRGRYVSNGALIAAALLAGFVDGGPGGYLSSRNAYFNMSERSLKAEDQRGNEAQSARRRPGW